MKLSQASLSHFCQWYEENREALLPSAQESKRQNEELREEFLKEWPIERLESMTLDEYVIGKGAQNPSLCYQLEHGKYKHLYMGIGGGAASKFGIYWSKDKRAYLDQANHVIAESELAEKFSRLKADLQAILRVGTRFDFDNPIFNARGTTNSFYGRSAMIIKLLCIYNTHNSYFAVNNSQTNFWEKMLLLDSQGGIYKQNYELTKEIQGRYPELDGATLGPIIHRYYHLLTEESDDIQERTKITMDYSKEVDLLLKSKNLIFRGAPGTGKTYLARQIAAQMIGCQPDDLSDSPQFEFVQFHPNYDYSDFVEGLRPINVDGNIGFKLQDGIFKAFCEKAKQSMPSLEGYQAYLEDAKVSSTKIKQYVDHLQFLLGLKEYTGKKIQGGMITFETLSDIIKYSDKVRNFDKENNFHNYFLTALNYLEKYHSEVSSKKFIFLIDEINRGDMAKIFGELFFSLDPSYRGKAGAISTQYANMHDTDEPFYIPENVYIIGTMNDIDRSVDSFDFAMRRRFRFLEIKAEQQLDMLDELGDKAEEAKSRLSRLNQAISDLEGLDSNYHIGPAYFLKLKDVDYAELWSDFIAPLLQEYLRGHYQAEEELEQLKVAFEGTDYGHQGQ